MFVLLGAVQLRLVLVAALGLDGFGAAVWVAVVVEEAAKGELVKGVFGVLPVAEPTAQRVVVVALVVALAQLFWLHRVEVGRVRRMSDGGHVRRRLLPEVTGEVDALEERVSFDFIDAVLAQAVIWAAAQLDDEVRRLRAELALRGDVQRALPGYHLVSTTQTLETTNPAAAGRCAAALAYLRLRLQGRVRQERRLSHNHFIQDDTNTPPVTELGVSCSRYQSHANY